MTGRFFHNACLTAGVLSLHKNGLQSIIKIVCNPVICLNIFKLYYLLSATFLNAILAAAIVFAKSSSL